MTPTLTPRKSRSSCVARRCEGECHVGTPAVHRFGTPSERRRSRGGNWDRLHSWSWVRARPRLFRLGSQRTASPLIFFLASHSRGNSAGHTAFVFVVTLAFTPTNSARSAIHLLGVSRVSRAFRQFATSVPSTWHAANKEARDVEVGKVVIVGKGGR